MKKIFLIFCIALLPTLVYGTTSAQKIDFNCEKVPLNFKGDDIVSLVSMVGENYTPPTKDEFEKNSEFEARLAVFHKKRAQFVSSTNFAVALVEEQFKTKYDSESGTLNLTITVQDIDRDYRAFPALFSPPAINWEENTKVLAKVKTRVSTYIGENAYGVKKEVQKVSIKYYGVSFQNIEKMKDIFDSISADFASPLSTKSDNTGKIEINIVADKTKAKALKGNCGILLFCKPYFPVDNRPPILYSWDYSDATIDDPVDSYTERRFLMVSINKIIVYNTKTGEILLKRELKSSSEQQKKS